MEKFISKIVLTLIIVTIIGCGGAEERKQAYLEKALKSYEEGAYDKARVDLRNVIQIDPKHAQAHFMVGKIMEREKEYKKAYGYYKKALELDPDNTEYLSKMGLIYLTINDLDNAKATLDKIQKLDKENIDGLILDAGITYRGGEVDKATSMMEEVFYNNPGHQGNSTFLASMYISEERFNEAKIVLEESIAINKDAVLLRAMLVDLLFQQNMDEKAIEELNKIIEIRPEVYTYRVKLAKYYSAAGQPKKAEKVLRDAIKSMPDDFQRRIMLVSFIKDAHGVDAAVEELREAVDKNPDVGEYKLALAKYLMDDNKKDQAIQVLKDTLKAHENDEYGVRAGINLINIYLADGEEEQANKILTNALSKAPNDANLNFMKARIEYQKNNVEQVIISLRTVLKEQPGNAEAYILLAEAHKKNDDQQQYNDTLTRAYNNVRTDPGELNKLADYYIRLKNYDKAEQIIDDSLSIDPKNYKVLLAKSKLLVKNKQYDEAASYADRLIVVDPTLPDGYIQKLPAYLSKEKYDEALSLMENAFDKTNGNSTILQVITTIHMDRGKHKKAIDRINEAIEQGDTDKEIAEYYILLSRVYTSIDKNDDAVKALTKAKALLPLWSKPYESLMKIYNDEKKYAKAEAILKEGIENIPNNTQLIFYLGGIYEKMDKVSEAIKQYERIYNIQPDNLLVVNNLAALLMERDDSSSMDRAGELIEKIEPVKQIAVRDTVAWYYYKKGDVTAALNIMKEVIEQAPDVPVFNYHIGMMYHKLGDKDTARKHLEVAANSKADFIGKEKAKSTLSKI